MSIVFKTIELLFFFLITAVYSAHYAHANFSFTIFSKKHTFKSKQNEGKINNNKLSKNNYAEKNKHKSNSKNGENNKKDNDDNKSKIFSKYRESEIKLNIGSVLEPQYLFTKQNKIKGIESFNKKHKQEFFYKNGNVITLLGKIEINPEFNYYSLNNNFREKIINIGFLVVQPFGLYKGMIPKRFVSKEYFYAKTKYVDVNIGSADSAATKMKVSGNDIASGADGVYGSWWRYVKLPAFDVTGMQGKDASVINMMEPTYILFPGLPNEAGFTTQKTSIGRSLSVNDFINGNISPNNLINGSTAQGSPMSGGYSNKISLYSKRIKGFSFGISYSPTTAKSGYLTNKISNLTDKYKDIDGGSVKNYTSLGLDYRKQFDRFGLGIAFSFTYEYGKSSPLRYNYNNSDGGKSSINISDSPYYDRHNLNAYALGAKIVYKKYSFAYSYGNWGNSLLNKQLVSEAGRYQVVNQVKKSFYHAVAFGADYGIVEVGSTYMCSSFSGYRLDAWSIGTNLRQISLKYIKFEPYIEYVGYIFHTQNIQLLAGDKITYKASANNGYVITLGLTVTF